MFCERCKIEFQPNERALWCRIWNCQTTEQREPTKEQRLKLQMESRWRGSEDD